MASLPPNTPLSVEYELAEVAHMTSNGAISAWSWYQLTTDRGAILRQPTAAADSADGQADRSVVMHESSRLKSKPRNDTLSLPAR